MQVKKSQEFGDQMEVVILIILIVATAIMFTLNQFKE